MKLYKNIIISALFAGAALTVTSCIGDLDLEPNDPNTTTAGNLTEETYEAVLAKCYSSMAVSGQTGPPSVSRKPKLFAAASPSSPFNAN